jgi:hypothetical protein
MHAYKKDFLFGQEKFNNEVLNYGTFISNDDTERWESNPTGNLLEFIDHRRK